MAVSYVQSSQPATILAPPVITLFTSFVCYYTKQLVLITLNEDNNILRDSRTYYVWIKKGSSIIVTVRLNIVHAQ